MPSLVGGAGEEILGRLAEGGPSRRFSAISSPILKLHVSTFFPLPKKNVEGEIKKNRTNPRELIGGLGSFAQPPLPLFAGAILYLIAKVLCGERERE